MKNNQPLLIEFPKIGDSSLGYISIAEEIDLPLEIKRIFWAFHTPDNVVRGRHAHHETEMILVAVSGRIIVNTEMPLQAPEVYVLENPQQGLFLPKYCWHTMQYSHNAVQLCMASMGYDEADYIRSYEEFKKIK